MAWVRSGAAAAEADAGVELPDAEQGCRIAAQASCFIGGMGEQVALNVAARISGGTVAGILPFRDAAGKIRDLVEGGDVSSAGGRQCRTARIVAVPVGVSGLAALRTRPHPLCLPRVGRVLQRNGAASERTAQALACPGAVCISIAPVDASHHTVGMSAGLVEHQGLICTVDLHLVVGR